MALYEQLSAIDIYGPIREALRRGLWKVSTDGIIRLKGHMSVHEEVWIRHRILNDRLCHLWLGIYFNYYGLIPTKCRECWKVVMKVENLRELMSVMQALPDVGYNCKCGLETREHSGDIGGYRAFFYSNIGNGITGGREMLKVVRKMFPGKENFLKRGCTEMELKYSPSDKWDELAEKNSWDLKTKLLDSIFKPEVDDFLDQPTAVKNTVLIKWIHWAFEHGDKTYLDYVDGEMVPGLFHYDNSNGSYNEPILEKEIDDESNRDAKLISLR